MQNLLIFCPLTYTSYDIIFKLFKVVRLKTKRKIKVIKLELLEVSIMYMYDCIKRVSFNYDGRSENNNCFKFQFTFIVEI
jgi:hypothetical protein